jgi:hypothetical protein
MGQNCGININETLTPNGTTDCMFICNMLMIEVMFWIGTLIVI